MNRLAAARLTILTIVLASLTLAGCSSRVFQRDTDTTGTFRTSATSVRFLIFFEVPFEPRLRAMELARDTWGDNVSVTKSWEWPNLGFFQFLNGFIVGMRGAVVEGEYGIPPNTKEGAEAFNRIKDARGAVRGVDGSPLTPREGVAK